MLTSKVGLAGRTRSVAALISSLLVASGLSACASAPLEPMRVAVMISGVASVSPFTTPEHACASGLSAGATNSFIRDYLTEHAIPVFTAPVMVGPGEVPAELPAAQGGDFGECPEQLPADLTVDSTNSVATAGKHLASFLGYLHEQYGVEQVDLIAHSLGGVFTRNAIRELQEQSSPVTVRTLTTLGSPWESSLMANTSDVPAEACGGFALCEVFMADLLAVPTIQQILDFLKPDSINAWNEQQVGVLDDIPVTLVAGTYFTKSAGTETKWPNDGFIQYDAATARNVPDSVLPQRACFSEPFTHSVYTSRYAGDTPSSAITWNDQSGLIVLNAIHSAGTPQQSINRLGCPTP